MSSKNRHNQKLGSTISRSDQRIANTAEVFTPPALCDKMILGLPESVLKDPTSTFLDNAAGNGSNYVHAGSGSRIVHTHSFGGSGSDTVTVSTMSPYYALCYIMKS